MRWSLLSVAVWVASASAISSPQVFNLLDVSQDVEQPIGGFTFDRPPAGGDQFAIYDKLYKWAGTKKGAPAGRVVGLGTFQTGFGEDFSHKATVLFVAQAYLQGGTVLVQGSVRRTPTALRRSRSPSSAAPASTTTFAAMSSSVTSATATRASRTSSSTYSRRDPEHDERACPASGAGPPSTTHPMLENIDAAGNGSAGAAPASNSLRTPS